MVSFSLNFVDRASILLWTMERNKRFPKMYPVRVGILAHNAGYTGTEELFVVTLRPIGDEGINGAVNGRRSFIIY